MPLLPGLSFKFRRSLLKDLNTSSLSGAEALDAMRVNNGPSIFFKNFLKMKINFKLLIRE